MKNMKTQRNRAVGCSAWLGLFALLIELPSDMAFDASYDAFNPHGHIVDEWFRDP